MGKNFRLKWNNFQACTSSSFRQFRENSEFFDVSLCCDNGTGTLLPVTLGAHKLILAACSPFFQRILSRVENQKSPFLFLKGIGLDELENLLDFMYNGEVTVSSNSIDKFLTAAKELEVKGLTYTTKPAEMLENNNSRPGSTANAANESETNSIHSLNDDSSEATTTSPLSNDEVFAIVEPDLFDFFAGAVCEKRKRKSHPGQTRKAAKKFKPNSVQETNSMLVENVIDMVEPIVRDILYKSLTIVEPDLIDHKNNNNTDAESPGSRKSGKAWSVTKQRIFEQKEIFQDYFDKLDDGKFYCKACPYSNGYFHKMKNHIEFRHNYPGYACPHCDCRIKTEKALRKHLKAEIPCQPNGNIATNYLSL